MVAFLPAELKAKVIDSQDAAERAVGSYLAGIGAALAEATSAAECLKARDRAEAVLNWARLRDAGRALQASALEVVLIAEARIAAEADAMRDAGELRGPGQPKSICFSKSKYSAREATGLPRTRLDQARALNEAGGSPAIQLAIQKVKENPEAPVTRKAIVLTAKTGHAPLVDCGGERARRPWRKWFWSDWRSDVRLRVCSLAARGLWAEMLAIMEEATPIGYLVDPEGKPLTARQLASLAAVVGANPEAQVRELLDELGRAGVYSKNGANVIYSRRVVRDEKQADVDRENGSRGGGNPTLIKENQELTPPPFNPQSPESREESISKRDSLIEGDYSLESKNQGRKEERGITRAETDLTGAPIRPEKYALEYGADCPHDWIKAAVIKGGLSPGEAETEWVDGFVAYWAQKGSTKDGRKRECDWRATWINFVTGDICQRRVQARRRNGRAPEANGFDDDVRTAIARGFAKANQRH